MTASIALEPSPPVTLPKRPPNKRRAHAAIPEAVDVAIVGGGLGG